MHSVLANQITDILTPSDNVKNRPELPRLTVLTLFISDTIGVLIRIIHYQLSIIGSVIAV